MTVGTNWKIWTIAFTLFLLIDPARAEEINSQFRYQTGASELKPIIKLPQKIKELGLTFDRRYREEISLRPSIELKKWQIKGGEEIFYQNDLRLEERAFYRASADFLNNWRIVKDVSERLERFSKVEIGFITETGVSVDPNLTPIEVPPKAPDPKVEVGFGEKRKKIVRVGMKFGGGGSLLSKKYLISPLLYARFNPKPANLQIRFSLLDQKSFLEAASNRPILGITSSSSYDVRGKQLNLNLSRYLASGNEIRVSQGINLNSEGWNVQLLFFSPITF